MLKSSVRSDDSSCNENRSDGHKSMKYNTVPKSTTRKSGTFLLTCV